MGVRVLPSGRHQARFRWEGATYTAVWDTAKQAEAWERRTRRELASGTYAGQVVEDPDTGKPLPPTFSEYAASWLEERDLKPRTRSEYRRMLPHMKPLNTYRLDQIDRARIADWHRGVKAPATHKAHVYSLCRAIFNSATAQGLIDFNPCLIERAGRVKRRSHTELPTPVQVHELADHMPSAKYRVLVLVSAWCGLRFGEATELRMSDVVTDGTGRPTSIKVRRGVVRVDGDVIVGTPKSDAGVRDVTIPPHIRGDLKAYLTSLPSKPDALLFPGTRNGAHIAPSSLYKVFYAARDEVGLPTLRWHDLRHFSATAAAQTGATLAELQARLGHSTVQAAMRYQHAASGRDAKIAEAMSNVIPLKSRNPEPVAEPEDDLRPVWLRLRTGGSWHMSGDAGKAYCGRKLYGELEEAHGDQPAGRQCKACAQRKARGA